VVSVERIAPTAPEAVELLAAMEAELRAVYGPVVVGRTPSATPAELAVFVVVREDGRAVAGGALKPLGPALLEIKRMYVAPDARRRGHGRRLLEGLESAARDLGAARLRLDTGPEQPHAQALYEAAGYRAIPDYNDNSYASFWGEKDLPAVIPGRFNGPPQSGHGGYSAWMAARYLDGPAEVTLHEPPPLEIAMDVVREDGTVRLRGADGEAILSARPAEPAVEPPAPLDPAAAHAVRDPSLWAAEVHPFPTCFACGPARPQRDGLQLYPGAVGDGRFATDWSPPPGCDESIVWAALDCPSSAPLATWQEGSAIVLARFACDVRSLPPAEPHTIVSEAVSIDGRKRTSAAALYSAGGELRALARALWIELR